MAKKMIFHVICAIIGAIIYYLFFTDALITDIIFFVFVYLVFSLIIEFVLSRKRNRDGTQEATADHTQVEGFIEAIGGVENIISTDFEASRVKIEVLDVGLIDPDQLKEFAQDGAYLAGNQLQIPIGPNSGDFSRQIRQAIE